MSLLRSSLHPFLMPAEHGQIEIIFGPMFSGKTTELMRRIKRYQIANKRCLVIKYANDNRYDNRSIATHDRQTLEAVSTASLLPLLDMADKMDVIGIDEGQFFPDVVSFCDQMAERGKVMIVAALDGTFQKKGFGDILQLVPLAEHVIKLTAVCMSCFSEASFTKRKGSETEVEVIGGADKYLATCRRCFKSPGKTLPAKESPRKESPRKTSPYKRSPKNSPLKNSPAKASLGGGIPLQDITENTQNLSLASANRKLFSPN